MNRSSIEPGTHTEIRQVLGQLAAEYGAPRHRPRFDPMEELVSCILSQHSADANSFPAFTLLRETFPDWRAVVEAGPAKVADVIRGAGLANQKAKSIILSLNLIHAQCGAFSLDFLREMNTDDAIEWLEKLPGVGPKTAAIVLCFAFGRHANPVDTHVSRVGKRLGLIPEQMTDAQAHTFLRESVSEEDAFAFHTLLIQHGRITCQAKKPACGKCCLATSCAWRASQGAS